MFNWSKWFYDFMYRFSKPRWDSGVTPPEVVEQVESDRSAVAGEVKHKRALDLGCGTGTNSIYLAKHGFETVGVDFVPKAVETARAKARQAGAKVDFYISDVTRLDFIREPFDLVLDIGCFHSLYAAARSRYADNLLRLTCPGGLYMLYAFSPRPSRWRNIGATQEEVRKLFGTGFALKRLDPGTDRGLESAWYWFVRT